MEGATLEQKHMHTRTHTHTLYITFLWAHTH